MRKRTFPSQALSEGGPMRRILSLALMSIGGPAVAMAALAEPLQQTSVSDGDTKTAIRQIDPERNAQAHGSEAPATNAATVDQLGSVRPAGEQTTSEDGAALPLPQVGDRDRAIAAGPQLSTGRPTAQASAPLSNPRQSPPQPVVRLNGPDKCDPAFEEAATADCANVIETRSAEYRSAAPPVLSPEQRLLIGQQQLEAVGDPAAVARRLGRNEIDADARDAQSVASLVLPGNPAQAMPENPENPTDGLSPDTINLIQAIVQNAQGAVPQ